MSKNAMAGAVTLCGVGLCMIGGALLMQGGQQAHAAAGSIPAAAGALASTATAQAGGEPTVVWYDSNTHTRITGINNRGLQMTFIILRAWSDGHVEMRVGSKNLIETPDGSTTIGHECDEFGLCYSPWFTVSSVTEGSRAAADINADEMVDGADLAMMLSSWGDAPRVPFPPSDCPLNLINP